MKNKKANTTLGLLQSLIDQINPADAKKQEQKLLQEDGVIAVEGDYVQLQLKHYEFKDPETGEIHQIPITQELLDTILDNFLTDNEDLIKEKLLDQLQDELPNQ